MKLGHSFNYIQTFKYFLPILRIQIADTLFELWIRVNKWLFRWIVMCGSLMLRFPLWCIVKSIWELNSCLIWVLNNKIIAYLTFITIENPVFLWCDVILFCLILIFILNNYILFDLRYKRLLLLKSVYRRLFCCTLTFVLLRTHL
jgi:hypothetical protein